MIQSRRTVDNLINVIGGEALLRLANALVAVLIGRVFGVAILGAYAAILASATLAERIADNGLELTGIAEASRQPSGINRLFTALYINKTVLSAIAIGVLAVVAAILGISKSQWLIAAVLTARTFLYSYCRLNAGLLKARNKTKPIAAIQALHFVVLTAGALVVYLRYRSLLMFLLCLLGAQLLEFVLTSAVLRNSGLRISAATSRFCWHLFRRSTPVGATYTLSTLMLRGDVVVLSLVASAAVVGTFAAANTGLVMIYVVAWLFSGILLADLGTLSNNREAFDMYFRKCLHALVSLTIPLAVLTALFAPTAIVAIFGRSFSSAGLPGALMMLALPFIFLNAAFLGRTVARNASRIALGIYGFAAALSLCLNYVLGRWQGAVGVACSILIREIIMTLLFVRLWKLPESKKSTEGLAPEPELAPLLNT